MQLANIGMDFLLALVASPLTKALEVSFLTGFITAYRLESSKRLRGGVLALPGWQKKKAQQTLKRRSSQVLMRVSQVLRYMISKGSTCLSLDSEGALFRLHIQSPLIVYIFKQEVSSSVHSFRDAEYLICLRPWSV